jgi:hypothetical protein
MLRTGWGSRRLCYTLNPKLANQPKALHTIIKQLQQSLGAAKALHTLANPPRDTLKFS